MIPDKRYKFVFNNTTHKWDVLVKECIFIGQGTWTILSQGHDSKEQAKQSVQTKS